MQKPEINRINSLMHVIESGNKAFMQRKEKKDKAFQSPKDRLYVSPDPLRYKTTSQDKLQSLSSVNFFGLNRLRTESTKHSEMKVFTPWTESLKTTNTGAEKEDKRLSQENSRSSLKTSNIIPNKDFRELQNENSSLKRRIADLSNENQHLWKENETSKSKTQELIEKINFMMGNEKAFDKMKELYSNLELKHNERKKHMKQLIEIISEKEKQLEKAKTLHCEFINKKFKEQPKEVPTENELNHQKIIEYALFLENQLEISEEKISSLLKDSEELKLNLNKCHQDLERKKVTMRENEEKKEMNLMIGNINQELKVIFESLKGIESQKKESENQYNNEFQNLEENEKKVIKRSIEDLEEQKQKLFNYLRGKQ